MSVDLKFIEGFVNFAMKIYSKTAQGDDKNFLFSPLNLSLGLSLCLAGAKKSSEAELKHLLDQHLSTSEINKNNAQLVSYVRKYVNGINFKFANRLYAKDGTAVNKEYSDAVKNFYPAADVALINFGDGAKAAHDLNEWVDSTLKVKFQRQILEAVLSSEFNLLLMNAVYFKGNWFKKFDKYLTKPADFHLTDGTTVQVRMMQLANRKFKFKENAAELSASVCEFPFADEGLAMTIILPNKDSTLAEVESQLTAEVLKETLDSYNFTVKVNVKVPEFRIESSSEFAEVFKNLDAPHSFSGFRSDFSGIAPNGQDLFVSKVFNKLVIEVDEEGNEAAPATGVARTTWKSEGCVGQAPEQFNCDRPFLFIIHDSEYHIPLIIGKLTKPTPL